MRHVEVGSLHFRSPRCGAGGDRAAFNYLYRIARALIVSTRYEIAVSTGPLAAKVAIS